MQQYGLMAAAIAFGLGAIGAGIAIANVGAAAMGAIGEKPEIASQRPHLHSLSRGTRRLWLHNGTDDIRQDIGRREVLRYR
ncbi:hypothetical protein MASR2M48_09060 [Spirochaetota bacterium]